MTLSQFAASVSNALRSRPELNDSWVIAELSDVRSSGGHCYMELIEKNELTGATTAKMRATIWASTYFRLRQKFYQDTGTDIVSGLKVLLRGGVQHHPVYGLSFNVADIDPSYTLGDMDRLRREIIEKLTQLNVINDNKELQFPLLPQRIAVISASGAAGFGDFMNQLQNNPDGFVVYPHLFNATMQGERTARSVISALDEIEAEGDKWDCVVIIRGGGATTDLNGFDNYELAYKIATYSLPVVVGIGHERDRTVLDEIACVRCKTPTAVAEFIIDSLRRAFTEVTQYVDYIIRYSTQNIAGEKLRLNGLGASIPAFAQARIHDAKMKLGVLGNKLPLLTQQRVQDANGKLNQYATMLKLVSGQRLDDGRREIRDIESMLKQSVEMKLRDNELKLKNIESMVDVLNPRNTLRRGYSVTRHNGKAVKDVAQLAEGDVVETLLYNGVIESEIIHKKD